MHALVLMAMLTQYPGWLQNSYVSANGGATLIPVFPGQARVGVHLEVGHEFGHHLSAQISYARPLAWERYRDHPVLTNFASLTLRRTLPIAGQGKISVFGEGGLAVITRAGLRIDGHEVFGDANYGTVAVGAGLQWRLSRAWDLQATTLYAPSKKSIRQPQTVIATMGLVLHMRTLSLDHVAHNADSDVTFPANVVTFSHATNEIGLGANRLFSSKIPVFWGGNVVVERGGGIAYERTVFHTRRLFALKIGASAWSYWSAKDGRQFWAFAVYPKLQFRPIHTRAVDPYVFYSLAGPAYVTQRYMDHVDTGRHFTFQDWMGVGVSFPRDRHISVEVGIGHYSNGNVFPRNGSIQVPLTVSLGYGF